MSRPPARSRGGASGNRVRWGGEIIKTEPGPQETCFYLMSHPLDSQARPELGNGSEGQGPLRRLPQWLLRSGSIYPGPRADGYRHHQWHALAESGWLRLRLSAGASGRGLPVAKAAICQQCLSMGLQRRVLRSVAWWLLRRQGWLRRLGWRPLLGWTVLGRTARSDRGATATAASHVIAHKSAHGKRRLDAGVFMCGLHLAVNPVASSTDARPANAHADGTRSARRLDCS